MAADGGGGGAAGCCGSGGDAGQVATWRTSSSRAGAAGLRPGVPLLRPSCRFDLRGGLGALSWSKIC